MNYKNIFYLEGDFNDQNVCEKLFNISLISFME